MYLFRLPRRLLVVRLAVVVLAAFSLLGQVAAAQSSDPSAPLAIRDALQAAWARHPGSRATEAQLAAAQDRLNAAGQPIYNPEIELSADDEGPDRTGTIGLNLTLDLSGKRGVRRDAASARLDLVSAQARLRRRDFAKQWFTSWAEVHTSRQRVSTGERRLGLMTRFGDIAEKQFLADDISGLERDLALLARDEAQAEQSQLIADQADAEARFRGVGGSLESLAALTLPTDTLPPPAAVVASVEQLPDWQAAQAALLATEREVAVARRNRIADPTVGLRGGRIDYGNVRDRVIGVSISVPLFVRNGYRAEVVAAQADVDVAAADADRVRLELEADRRRAIDSYAAAQSTWTRWKASRGTDIERRTTLLERLWREGELSTANYLQQLKQTLDTQLAGAELEARLWRSYTDYLAATGQLERWAGLEGTP
ncbi:MAG: TolC family protein [Xanthomonadales bacterium]|nr:TolC family protein [Xanthomonadales bacterium]